MLITDNPPDIMFITECIPKAQRLPIAPALLAVPGYCMFSSFNLERCNLGSSGLRGICVYVREHLHASVTHFPESPHVEHLWIKVKLQGGDCLIAGCVYRSPSANPHLSMEDINSLFRRVSESNPSHLLVCGDFNIPAIDWSSQFSPAPESHIAHKLLALVHEHLLYQHVTQPTRYREGVAPSTLDLIFTNEEGMISTLEYQPGIGLSDHVVLTFKLNCYTTQATRCDARLNFHKADFPKLSSMISDTDWRCLSELDAEAGLQLLKKVLRKSVEECIPTARSSRSRKNLYMTSQALRLKKRKLQLWLRYVHSHDPLDLSRYKSCRNKLRSLTRKLRQLFETELASNLKNNPKAFWRYTNSRLKTRSKIADLRSENGTIEHEDGAKATILNSFFGSVFTREELSDVPTLTIERPVPELSDIDISPPEVELKLHALNPSSAPGPDDIHPRILREARQALSGPLTLLFRKSLDTGTVPRDWTLGRVVPIYKKGSKQDPGNYRPVSLTSVIGKVLESLIRDKVMLHLTANGLLSDHQHGFRPKRSCSTNLVDVLDDWSRILECRSPLDVVYLDFRKAFDTVPHRRLLYKLQCYGIRGKLFAWIQSFLTARRQQVVVNGCTSGWIGVASGVPQGTVLGPILFLLYINDLPDVVDRPVRMFADDTKLFSRVASIHEVSQLQSDLEALALWSEMWLMPFNQDKCKVLHIGHSNPTSQYSMGASPIGCTEVEKDLGVLVDTELKFRQQAAAVVAKATQLLSVIRRSFAQIDKYTLPLLYKSLVRPHLEFGNLAWGPFNRTDQKLIERVQRRATRLVTELRDLPYVDRLRSLRLPSLYYRRRRGDMIYLYQLFHRGVDADPAKLFNLATERTTRGHPFKVLKPTATSRVRRSVLAVRAVNDWNSLPADVVCSPSVNSFKTRLDAHWAHLWYRIPETD